jgi:magnesium transporter
MAPNQGQTDTGPRERLTDALESGTFMQARRMLNGLSGALIPVTLNKPNVEPALAGGMALTSIVDAVGFITFPGLAKLLYA